MRLIRPYSFSFFVAVLFLFAQTARAQTPADTTRKHVLQLSGVVLDADSLSGIPFTAIVIKNSNRGVYSSYSGYFTIVCEPKDTIEFFCLGYRHASFIVPDTIKSASYSYVQTLRMDTVMLRSTVIYPWPTKEEFKQSFLALDVPDDDLLRAQRNLQQQQMALLAQNMGQDGKMAYSSVMRQQTAKNYYAGQMVPNNLLNPIAWSKFLQALSNGDLKRQ